LIASNVHHTVSFKVERKAQPTAQTERANI
jgi:hypothetical protein